MAPRIYFEDALTGRAIDTPWNGRAYVGVDACGVSPRTAVAYNDTTWSVRVDLGRGQERRVSAEDFPGQLVRVKLWGAGFGEGRRAIEYALLITREDGFVMLHEVAARGAWRRDSYGERFRDHERGLILANRKALDYLAARRQAMSPAALAAAFGKGRG